MFEVIWTTSDYTTSADGEARASANFATYTNLSAAIMPPTYYQSSKVRFYNVIWPLMSSVCRPRIRDRVLQHFDAFCLTGVRESQGYEGDGGGMRRVVTSRF